MDIAACIEKINSNMLFLIIFVLFAIISVISLLCGYFFSVSSEVMEIYFPYADQVMGGMSPNMEYPPFGLILLMIPRLFTDNPFVYNALFVAEIFIFFTAGLLATRRLAAFYGRSQNQLMLVYFAFLLIMIEFVVDRYDMFPVALTLLSLYFYVTKRYMLALLLLSVATMTKIYPLVLFPIYIIPFFVNRDWKNIQRVVGFLAVVISLMMIIPYVAGFGLITNFIGYHSSRPLQIESVAASFISLADMLGITETGVEYSFGSFNLTGSWSNAVAPYMTRLMGACILAVYVLYTGLLLKARRIWNDQDSLMLFGCGAALTILLFIIAGLVFSAQYVLWTIPFLLFLFLVPIDVCAKKKLLTVTTIVVVLTSLNAFVNLCLNNCVFTDTGLLIILFRNIFLLILAYLVLRIAWDCVNGHKESAVRALLKSRIGR